MIGVKSETGRSANGRSARDRCAQSLNVNQLMTNEGGYMYWDLYERESIAVPSREKMKDSVPWARSNWGEL
jgi:hypothetical protein